MPFKTDLNVTPYYDDHDSSDNFQQVLARPGFAVQARELTQLQSILKHNMERLGDVVLKEGTVVIPCEIKAMTLPGVKLESSYGGETIDVTQYLDKTITGTTTGVQAVVVETAAATTTDKATLYLRYIKSGTDNSTIVFKLGETLSASAAVTHGSTSYSTDDISAQVLSDSTPVGYGFAVKINAGVYYVRGGFVEVAEETLILEKYQSVQVNYRVGFAITETIVTPEADSSLLDNATGTSNYAAKGAHRLKVSVKLANLALDYTADSNFVELM